MKTSTPLILITILMATNQINASASTSCGNLEDYEVRQTSFSKLPLGDALKKITEGMPYQTIVSGSDDIKISTTGISGTLDAVLNKLAKGVGFTYNKNGCQITITPNVAQAWILKKGQPIHTQLQEWGARAGWTVNWEIEKTWAIPAETRFGGTFQQALEQVIKTLYSQGYPIYLEMWDDNHVADIKNSVAR